MAALLVASLLAFFSPLILAQDICSSGLPVADGVCSNGDEIPGVAGVDYPIFREVPQTSFSCDRVGLPGYYADPEAACQAFYICERGGKGTGFLCPNGTLFNQEVLVCDWWTHVDCSQAVNFYSVNERVVAEMEAANERLGVNQRERERLAAAGLNPDSFNPFNSRFNASRPFGFNPYTSPYNANSPFNTRNPALNNPFNPVLNNPYNPAFNQNLPFNNRYNPNRPFNGNNPALNPFTNPSLNPYTNPALNPYNNPTLNPYNNPAFNPSKPNANPYNNPAFNPYNNPAFNAKNPALNPYNNPAFNPNNPALNPYNNPAFNPNNPALNPYNNPAFNPNNPLTNPYNNPAFNPYKNPAFNPYNNPFNPNNPISGPYNPYSPINRFNESNRPDSNGPKETNGSNGSKDGNGKGQDISNTGPAQNEIPSTNTPGPNDYQKPGFFPGPTPYPFGSSPTGPFPGYNQQFATTLGPYSGSTVPPRYPFGTSPSSSYPGYTQGLPSTPGGSPTESSTPNPTGSTPFSGFTSTQRPFFGSSIAPGVSPSSPFSGYPQRLPTSPSSSNPLDNYPGSSPGDILNTTPSAVIDSSTASPSYTTKYPNGYTFPLGQRDQLGNNQGSTASPVAYDPAVTSYPQGGSSTANRDREYTTSRPSNGYQYNKPEREYLPPF